MSIELVAVFIAGVVSTFDFVVNIATLCFTRCQSDCCGIHLEHDDSSRASSPQRDDLKE